MYVPGFEMQTTGLALHFCKGMCPSDLSFLCFPYTVYGSSRAMHPGSAALYFERLSIKLRFRLLYANQGCPVQLTAPLEKTNGCRVKIKTDSATSQLISQPKCLQEYISVNSFSNIRISFQTSSHVGLVWNARADSS